jgi:SAM-dependent methyltransferase
MPEPSDVSDTRRAYDIVATDYAHLLQSELASKPMDRAVIAAFSELVQATGNRRVADIGCGPGRVTAHLDSLGLEAFGVDLSPVMVAIARQAHPSPRFEEGTMEALRLESGRLGGVVAWYSVIHTPPDRLPGVFQEFARVLSPGGYLLVAFQTGDEHRHISRAYGHDVDLDVFRLDPERIATMLEVTGLAVTNRLLRAPDESEKTPQAFLLARKH